MCVIILKQKGIKRDLINLELLEKCEKKNPHGMGITHIDKKTNKIKIKKNFKNIFELYSYYTANIIDDDICIIHFRKMGMGKLTKEQVMPFPISTNYEDLIKDDIVCDIAVVHNGVINKYIKNENYIKTGLSDTQLFILEILSNFTKDDLFKNDGVKKVIKDYLNNNKMILFSNDKSLIFGQFVKSEKYGELLFSNLEFERKNKNKNKNIFKKIKMYFKKFFNKEDDKDDNKTDENLTIKNQIERQIAQSKIKSFILNKKDVEINIESVSNYINLFVEKYYNKNSYTKDDIKQMIIDLIKS